MTTPCDKGPALERIESKVDRLTDLMTDVAVQRNDIAHLTSRMANHEGRIKAIEAQPGWTLKALGTAILAFLLAWLGFELRR